MVYIYHSAKNRRSGNATQKMPLRGSLSRWELARECMAGFPWNGSFQSREQIDEYLGGDKIICLLCGKPYATLCAHIKRVHGIASDDYKQMFGIAQKDGLTSLPFRSKLSKNGLMESNMARARGLHSLAYANKQRGGTRPRPMPGYAVNEAIFRIYGKQCPGCEDFSWHLKMAEEYEDCTNVPPPDGIVSWSTFKKHRLKDAELFKKWKSARARPHSKRMLEDRRVYNGKRKP